MKLFTTFLLFTCIQGCAQAPKNNSEASLIEVGGRCEGCEAVFEAPIPLERLSSVDTIAIASGTQKEMLIKGIVFANDGKTPAADVVVYMYHTDETGVYPSTGSNDWGRRHGKYRGWVRTGKDGSYSFLTIRPASYPRTTAAAHVHITVYEQGKTPYFIDDILFEDDPHLTSSVKQQQGNRGGTGIVNPSIINGRYTVERDIILGKNIDNYR